MVSIEAEFVFNFTYYKVEETKEIANKIKTLIKSDENLYFHVHFHKTKRNSYLSIEFDSNTSIDVKDIEQLFPNCKITKYAATQNLNCIFSEEKLSKDFVENIKRKYNISSDIIEIPYDEGDDYNFISSTPHHYNLVFDKIVIEIQKPFENIS